MLLGHFENDCLKIAYEAECALCKRSLEMKSSSFPRRLCGELHLGLCSLQCGPSTEEVLTRHLG